MHYQQALDTLAALGPELRTGNAGAPRKFTLDHIRTLLAALDDPQRRFPAVLIAGTNGKGSTAATLAAVTTAAGLRTGLYTSPHLARVNERIRIDSVEIPDAAFGETFGQVMAAAASLVPQSRLPHLPSFFELLTATAFVYFAAQHIQFAVLEVGLGGRLDATNVVDPLVSVITDIGLDHTEFLGHTLSEIAREKAGILRPNGVLVTLSQHPEANAAIGEAAMALNVRGVDASRALPPRGFVGELPLLPPLASTAVPAASLNQNEREAAVPIAHTPTAALAQAAAQPTPLGRNRYPLSLEGQVLLVDSPLAGQHQQRNVALAIAAALELRANHGLTIPNAAIEEGIRNTQWPGRLEWLPPAPGTVHAPLLLDVAHNPAGAWTLRAALAQLPDDRPRTLLFSALADKQIDEITRILLPLFDPTSGDPHRRRDHIVLAPIPNPRAATVEQLQAAAHALDIPVHAAPHLAAALGQARALTPPDGVVVVTGSVYLVGAVRALALSS